jgi:mannose/fructose/N-acetylgalactosamine-specific phosphotransferase system component IID
LKIGIIENSIATTLAVEWAYQLDPIIQKVYTNQGEQDQVENTIQFAKTADQLIPQLQRVFLN